MAFQGSSPSEAEDPEVLTLYFSCAAVKSSNLSSAAAATSQAERAAKKRERGENQARP